MNTTHVHLLLNHVPVVGAALGLLILSIGCWRKSEEIKKAALILFAAVTLVAIPAYVSGEPAEDGVKGLPGISKPIIEKHEDAAAVAFTGIVALGLFAIAGLIRYRRERPVPPWFTTSAVVASVIVCGLMAWTANLGGQVRHTEIRTSGGSSASIDVPAKLN
jgi:uncharacterized membrane protein